MTAEKLGPRGVIATDDAENDALRGQFVICRDQPDPRLRWTMRTQSGWFLHAHVSMGIIDIIDSAGSRSGWLLGYPINTASGSMVEDAWNLGCIASREKTTDIERALDCLAGRYVLVLLAADTCRLYLDPSGSLSVLYSESRHMAGSTAEALLETESSEPSLVQQIRLTREQSGTWYPCGFTQWNQLRALPPNHYLDLDTWVIKRHWPVARCPPIFDARDPHEIVIDISKRITENIRAVAVKYPTMMGLTAGRDTRMLLACARQLLDRIQFFTLECHSPVDLETALKIAHVLKLKHCVDDVGDIDKVLLQGAVGEVGRSFYWRLDDDRQTRLTGCELALRMNFPDTAFAPQLQQWLDELPSSDPFLTLDLLYIEHRTGMAQSPANYDHDRRYRFTLFPMNDRRIFDLMLSLPPAYRIRQRLCDDICRSCWPELILFPINSVHFGGLGKYLKLIQQFRCKTLSRTQKEYLRERTFPHRSALTMVSEDIQKLCNRLARRLKSLKSRPMP